MARKPKTQAELSENVSRRTLMISVGMGAMVAVEFKRPDSHEPDPDFTKRVQTLALEKGLILLSCGLYGNVLRFLFPLTIPQAQFDEGLSILTQALQSA